MKNPYKLIGIIVLVAVIGFSFAACDNGTTNSGKVRQPMTYSGTNGETSYTLMISPPASRAVLAGDDFMLVVSKNGGVNTSVGKVKTANNNVFVLQPSVANAPAFSVATSGEGIASISDTITYTNGTNEPGPGAIHAHTWGAWTMTAAATCTAPGVETRVCSLNSVHTEIRNTAALGHNWGAWAKTKAPTAAEAGEETRTCTRDSSHKETRVVPATGDQPGAGGASERTSTYIQDRPDRYIEIIFSSRQIAASVRAVEYPQNGDNYVIKLNGAVISRGVVQINGTTLTFVANGSNARFEGDFPGDESLRIRELPYNGGTLLGIRAFPPGYEPPDDSGGSGASPWPSILFGPGTGPRLPPFVTKDEDVLISFGYLLEGGISDVDSPYDGDLYEILSKAGGSWHTISRGTVQVNNSVVTFLSTSGETFSGQIESNGNLSVTGIPDPNAPGGSFNAIVIPRY